MMAFARLLARESPDDGLVEAIRRDEFGMEELSKDFYVERLLVREEFLAARGELTARLEANRTKLAQRSRSRVLGDFIARRTALAEAWGAGSLEWRRSMVGALLEQVVILSGKPGRLPFDAERVVPQWRR